MSNSPNANIEEKKFEYLDTYQYSYEYRRLICYQDELFGIASEFTANNHTLIRDARNTPSLDGNNKIQPNDPRLLCTNLLLRELSLVRGIDYLFVTENKANDNRVKLNKLFANLVRQLIVLSQIQPPITAKQLEEIEGRFNACLYKILEDNKLTEGVSKPDDLLVYLRHMAGLLDPAFTLFTYILLEIDKHKIEQTDLAIPITKKTDIQKFALCEMKKVENPTEGSFQDALPKAMRQINASFYPLAIKDDRQFHAQMRKYIPPTCKNLWKDVITTKLITKGLIRNNPKQHIFLRMGTPVYVGKGKLEQQRLLETTKENYRQIHQSIGENVVLHNTSLNTPIYIPFTDFENENVMIDTATEAVRGSNDCVENIGVNGRATLWSPDNPQKAVKTIVQNINDTNKTEVINCASGQDRTGTLAERVAIELTAEDLKELAKPEKKVEEKQQEAAQSNYLIAAEQLRNKALHNATLASILSPGSSPMKPDSEQSSFFSAITRKYFYNKNADTNKKAPVRKRTDYLTAPLDAVVKDPSALGRYCNAIMPVLKTEEERKNFHTAVIKRFGEHYKVNTMDFMLGFISSLEEKYRVNFITEYVKSVSLDEQIKAVEASYINSIIQSAGLQALIGTLVENAKRNWFTWILGESKFDKVQLAYLNSVKDNLKQQPEYKLSTLVNPSKSEAVFTAIAGNIYAYAHAPNKTYAFFDKEPQAQHKEESDEASLPFDILNRH